MQNEKSILPDGIKIQYVRNRRGQMVGTFVAIPIPETKTFTTGWAKCKVNADKVHSDIFNKDRGRTIAIGRAHQLALDTCAPPIAKTLEEDYVTFVDRCKGYFSDKQWCIDIDAVDFVARLRVKAEQSDNIIE